MAFQSFKAAKQAMIAGIAKLLPPCSEVARLASESMERKLSFGERVQVRVHNLICAWCRRYARQLQFLRQALHRHPESHDASPTPLLSPDARARMKRALGAQPN